MSGRGATASGRAWIEGVPADEADVLEPERAGDGLPLLQIPGFEVAQLGGDAHRFTPLQGLQHVAARARGDVHEMHGSLPRVHLLDGLLHDPLEQPAANPNAAPAGAVEVVRDR